MNWSTSQLERLAIEKELLECCFDDRVNWLDETESTTVELSVTTSNDSIYQLRLYVPRDYPHSLPDLVVCDSPKPMPNWGSSGATHTLGDREGYLKICYCRPTHWKTKDRMYEVFIKGLVWLEAYEGYLSTGKSLEHFLAYMPK